MRRRLIRVALAWAVAIGVASCGGGGGDDGVPAPPTVERLAMTGTVSAGSSAAPTADPGTGIGQVSAKGTAGFVRVANARAGSSDYEVSLSQLSGPYALSAYANIFDVDSMQYTLAATPGTANLTPLTTLLIAQLYGQDPASVFNSFGPGGSVDATRITEAALQSAQVQLAAFLQQELGYRAPTGAGSWVTTPFRAVAGDPMYDGLTALAAALRARGTSFAALSASVALASRQCQIERIGITIGGVRSEFCPQTKSATPTEGDPTLLVYVFVNRLDDRLTVDVRGDSVIDAGLVTAAGARYACNGSGCSGLALGPVASDLTRPIVFDALALQGAGGNATLDGELAGAIPGVVLPVLPCSTNRFIVVFSDRTVVGQCADPDPFGWGVGGVPGSLIGVDPSRGDYVFTAPAGSDPNNARIEVLTDGYDTVIGVQFTDQEPDTYVNRRRYVCLFEACNGIAIGPLTINTDFGGPDFPFYIRSFDFRDTVLVGVDDDGRPNGSTATLRASLSAAYLLPIPPVTYPTAQTACVEGRNALAIAAGGSNFVACVPPGTTAAVPDSSDIVLAAMSVEEADDKLTLVLRNGALASATLHLSVVPGDFACTGGSCTGITLSAPAADGSRTVGFDGTVLTEQLFGVAGRRSITLGPTALGFSGP